ncbi:DUF4181 domain-containing protein [Lysinibacillus sp. NPDC097287]|uniref:DUF4181 domain-containing protein n=1 Tax=Lysinibacillus sp. NPDC097287 TaxID=3364144 RepID=UPI00381B997C
MSEFFAKLILVSSIYGLFLFLINKFFRKWLNVEKKKKFSYNYVNDKHKKIDWTLRIIFIFFLFISFFINVNREPLNHIWFLETHILFFVVIVLTEIVRVIMEKRYAENKNDYLFSAIQLMVTLIFLLLLFSTNFFGLFG